MNPPKPKGKNSVTVSGLWFPMPVEFLLSRVCASLSPHALKMFIDLCSRLKANGYGNGDLSAAPAVMRPLGWASNTTRLAALAELIEAGVVCITRQGGRRRCSLYAVTLWPIQGKLDKPMSVAVLVRTVLADWVKARTVPDAVHDSAGSVPSQMRCAFSKVMLRVPTDHAVKLAGAVRVTV